MAGVHCWGSVAFWRDGLATAVRASVPLKRRTCRGRSWLGKRTWSVYKRPLPKFSKSLALQTKVDQNGFGSEKNLPLALYVPPAIANQSDLAVNGLIGAEVAGMIPLTSQRRKTSVSPGKGNSVSQMYWSSPPPLLRLIRGFNELYIVSLQSAMMQIGRVTTAKRKESCGRFA